MEKLQGQTVAADICDRYSSGSWLRTEWRTIVGSRLAHGVCPLGNLGSFMEYNPGLSASLRLSFARDVLSGIQALHAASLV